MGQLLGGLASIAGGIGGAVASQGDVNNATGAQQSAIQAWLSANVPDPAQQQIELQNYQLTGQFSPTLQQTFQNSQNAFNNINVNPTGQSAEEQSLAQMQNIASNGGMDAQAKAQLQAGIQAANTNEQGQVGAIQQQMAARGMGGATGAGEAAMLQSTQNNANASAMAGTSAAATAEQNALNAMNASAGIGSNLYNQSYQQQSQQAAAQNAINQWNAQNAQAVNAQNANAQTQAQALNTNAAQQVSNANTNLSNQQQMYNKQLTQQQYEDEIQKAGGLSGQYQNYASGQMQQANRTAGQWSGAGNAVNTMAQGFGSTPPAPGASGSGSSGGSDPNGLNSDGTMTPGATSGWNTSSMMNVGEGGGFADGGVIKVPEKWNDSDWHRLKEFLNNKLSGGK